MQIKEPPALTERKTKEDFWSEFWQKIKLPETVNLKFKNDRVIAKNFLKYIPKANYDKHALEVGCAPGKWLAFFNKELNYHISGIEYVSVAADKTIENFKLLHLDETHYSIQNEDFFNLEATFSYDVVFSLGFIEHFENWQAVIDKHLQYCKSGSYLVIGLPNFNGLNFFIQKAIDNISKDNLLAAHNLNVMNLKLLTEYANKRNLQIEKLSYIGGFERGLFNTNVGNRVIKFALKTIVYACTLLFGSYNTRYTSSYIFGVFKVK